MTTSYRQYRRQQAPSALWGALVVLGIAVTALGILLITRPFDTAETLAWLAGLALVLSGVTDAIRAAREPDSGPSGVLFGVVLVVGGALLLAWPDVTLWTVALVVGACLVAAGLVRLAGDMQARKQGQRRTASVVLAVATIVVGLLAMAWPSSTIAVLAVLFGIQLVFQGVGEIILGLALRPAHHSS